MTQSTLVINRSESEGTVLEGLNRHDGRLVWKFKANSLAPAGPKVREAEREVFVLQSGLWGTTAGYFAGLDAKSGATIWRRPPAPVWIEGDDIVLVQEVPPGEVFDEGRRYPAAALNKANGKRLWATEGIPMSLGPRVAVFAREELPEGPRVVVAVDTATGRDLWSRPIADPYIYLYSLVRRGTVVLQEAGTIFGLDPITGREKWRLEGQIAPDQDSVDDLVAVSTPDASRWFIIDAKTGGVLLDRQTRRASNFVGVRRHSITFTDTINLFILGVHKSDDKEVRVDREIQSHVTRFGATYLAGGCPDPG